MRSTASTSFIPLTTTTTTTTTRKTTTRRPKTTPTMPTTLSTSPTRVEQTNNMFNLPPRIPTGFDRDEHLKGIKKLMSLLELMKPEKDTSEIVKQGNFGINTQRKVNKNDMVTDEVIVMDKNKLIEEILKIDPKLKKKGQFKLNSNDEHVFTKHENVEETTITPFKESTTPYLQATPIQATTQTTIPVTQSTTETTVQTTIIPVTQTTIPYVERINPFLRKNGELKEVDDIPYLRPNIQVIFKISLYLCLYKVTLH